MAEIEVIKNGDAELVLKYPDGTTKSFPKPVVNSGGGIVITVTGGMGARCKNPNVKIVRGD